MAAGRRSYSASWLRQPWRQTRRTGDKRRCGRGLYNDAVTLKTVRAGKLTAGYEGGGLRYIRAGKQEVLRRVMVAVRDREWKTIPAQLSNETIVVEEDSFRIEFDARHTSSEVDFAWHGCIEGDAHETIRFHMSGAPLRPFWRNRIGWCVLHPIAECAGRSCDVEHTDGARERLQFPEWIAPHQPFLNVRALTHEVTPGVFARVCVDGDEFETEDQRNWGDASFKTYSTRLALPFPVLVSPGDQVRQSVELTVSGPVPPAAAEPEVVVIHVDRDTRFSMPAITGPMSFGFVDLNRNRDLVRWVIDPRSHAADELTMIENLAGLAPMIRTARTFRENSRFHVSVLVPPIRAAAGWVAASINELAQAGVASVAYDAASPVIDEIRNARPAHVIASLSDAPLRCSALVLESGAWVANFTETKQRVRIGEQSIELDPFELRRC